ncbi:MAG: UDP-glucose 4-epimerase [Candidatus Firestonebacteria bacterium RIFOXYC2_FULL_39_67]|nr:MAG: UDP-glucose 4-epimerase [Candidatus Firestonebacteria bacterium RIFOXYD2_FULL_39_29]OGF56719.1 MAG: UDP-glucose 4-epimerase [Candidatus Firestonebacteria bacterium RIFOXYC2_FULL_39_67]
MKVVITGGAGFIGSHIGDLLVEKGYEVIAIDNLFSGRVGNVNKKARFYKADIRSGEILQILKKEKPYFIVHEAAQMSVSASVRDPLFDAENNIIGTLNLLEFARTNGVKKFVFASSGGTVYGEPVKFPVTEKFPLGAVSPYGISKMTAEYYFKFYKKQYNLNYTCLRYSNVYGPRQDPHGEAGVMAIFSKAMLAGITPTINGDGKYIRDYVYCKDVARANLLALESGYCGSINIGTGRGADVNEIYGHIARAAGFKSKPNYGPERAGDIRKNILSAAEAKKVLKWVPKMKLEKGIKETVAYFKEQKN